MSYQTLLYEKLDHIGLITLNRPERLNAINRTMLRELQSACVAVEQDDDIRAVVLTGAGNTFSSGFDLKEQAKAPPQGVDAWRPVLEEDFAAIMGFWYLSKPTIAAVRGHALAGAFEMMLACDMTVAAEGSVFGEPELKFGAGIVAMLMPWHTGPKQAKEVLLTANDRIDAERALTLGLINKIVPAGQEVSAALDLANRIARMNPNLVRQTKAAINRTYQIMGMGEALAMALDVDILIEGAGTDDKREFMERTRKNGLRSAIVWRDARFKED
jgi:enoyl-CoA hydratase